MIKVNKEVFSEILSIIIVLAILVSFTKWMINDYTRLVNDPERKLIIEYQKERSRVNFIEMKRTVEELKKIKE